MQTSLTVVIERNATLSGVVYTEPYEAGWAREALWFVHVFEVDGGSKAEFVPQISPDGLHWCDHCAAAPIIIAEPGMQSLAVSHFGHWLRLRSRVAGESESTRVKAHIYLVCKS